MIDTTWIRDLAYAVGLIATDGSLSKDGRHLDLTSKDYQLLETFRDVLGLSNKIGRKSNGVSSSIQYRVQFGDVAFYKWLQSIGLHANKSNTIGALNVPNEYYVDFFRGVFDGDGSVWSYWDKRWDNSYMYYTTISSASPLFLNWLEYTNAKILGVKGHISKSGSVDQLKYAKTASKTIFDAMYYQRNLARLVRKHDRFIEILHEDPYP